jgi:hypothetical protein
MTETVTEVTFRAVFRHAGVVGSTFLARRSTAAKAWADADNALAKGHDFDGEWVVQTTTTTTTTEDVTR